MNAEPYRAIAKRLSAATLLAFFGTVVFIADSRADYIQGEQAYSLRQFTRAIEEFKPLLERGHSGAEMMTGLMYLQGDGYPRNPAKAAVWLYKAATKGDHSAQLVFGSQRLYGHGVNRDLVDAFKWLTLAASSENAGVVQQAIVFRDAAQASMTSQEIEAARKSAARFRPWRDGFVNED
ncbi:MAG: hypothetical protein RID42_13580 [Alphaproteobacteria bacterium]